MLQWIPDYLKYCNILQRPSRCGSKTGQKTHPAPQETSQWSWHVSHYKNTLISSRCTGWSIWSIFICQKKRYQSCIHGSSTHHETTSGNLTLLWRLDFCWYSRWSRISFKVVFHLFNHHGTPRDEAITRCLHNLPLVRGSGHGSWGESLEVRSRYWWLISRWLQVAEF